MRIQVFAVSYPHKTHVLNKYSYMLVRSSVGTSFWKNDIEGRIKERIQVTERRGRRSKQLPDDLQDTRKYWKLKEEAPERTLWTRFVRGYGTDVRQTMGWMNEWLNEYIYIERLLYSCGTWVQKRHYNKPCMLYKGLYAHTIISHGAIFGGSARWIKLETLDRC
jgi:hypothetical protein